MEFPLPAAPAGMTAATARTAVTSSAATGRHARLCNNRKARSDVLFSMIVFHSARSLAELQEACRLFNYLLRRDAAGYSAQGRRCQVPVNATLAGQVFRSCLQSTTGCVLDSGQNNANKRKNRIRNMDRESRRVTP